MKKTTGLLAVYVLFSCLSFLSSFLSSVTQASSYKEFYGAPVLTFEDYGFIYGSTVDTKFVITSATCARKRVNKWAD